MTVSTTTNKIRYSGTGSQYVFPYTFKIFADADLEVILTSTTGVDTTKTLTTHYTVSGAGSGSGGNVTMITAPASGEYLTVKRNLDILQETDYVENDPFPAESHENALDRLTMICQQINEAVDRALKMSVGSGLSDITFPPLVANEYLLVNPTGDGLETTALLSSLGSEAAAVAQCVQLVGDQTVAGTKTFTSFPVTPSSLPSSNYQVCNKLYRDTKQVGDIVQIVNTQTGAVATGTTQMPYDDTIPQNSEGDEYMTLAITPTSASNKLIIDVIFYATSDTGSISVAIFQDTAANALAAISLSIDSAGRPDVAIFRHYMNAGTTSATTFKVRAGLNGSGTTTFNGTGGDRRFGGVAASSITIIEVKA
jgi:hypothetical protein